MDALDRLTFAEFQATGQDVPSLYEHISDLSLMGEAGRLYARGLYLNAPVAPGKLYTLDIGNFGREGTVAELEVELYAYYLGEGTDDDVRPYLHDVAPESDFWPKDPDTEESLCDLLAAFCKFHGLPPRSADELLATEGVSKEQCDWLVEFIQRWDSTMETADAMARNDVIRLQARSRVPAIPTPSHGPAFPQLDELLAAARPLAKSLTRHITADNAMTPQAVMVRRLNAALEAFPEVP